MVGSATARPPAVLGLKLPQPPRLVNPEAAVFGAPAVEGLLRDTDAPGSLDNSTARGDDHLRLSNAF